MKKKELLAMPQVTAPSEMIAAAEADQPYIDKRYSQPMTRYPHRAYLKCLESNGILKASFFLRESLITGGVLPAYELYISKEQRNFVTYDRLHNQWRKAKLDQIDWPYEYYCDKRAWVDPESERIIREYFNAEHGGYDELLNFQREVREEQLLARHKRETDPWDEDLKQIPPLPKDWLKWVDKIGIPEHFIYYRYKKGGAKVGYCTHCEHEVPIKNPRYNKVGRCPRCRQPVTFKSEKKPVGCLPRNIQPICSRGAGMDLWFGNFECSVCIQKMADIGRLRCSPKRLPEPSTITNCRQGPIIGVFTNNDIFGGLLVQ